MKSRAYIGFLLLAAASAGAPAVGLAQTIPDSPVAPLKQFSVEALNERIEVVHGDRTQVHGIGAFSVKWVVPAYEQKAGEDPGTAAYPKRPAGEIGNRK